MKKEERQFTRTWFFKWILSNKAVSVLSVSLLFFLNVLVFSKISFIFQPVVHFMAIILLPIVISALLYYLLNPIVTFMEKRGMNRLLAIALVFIAILGLIIWGILVLIPNLQEQGMTIINNAPEYFNNVEKQIERLIQDERFDNYRADIETMVSNFTDQAVQYIETLSKSAISAVSSFASTVAKVAVAIMISPFILFYLLRDSGKISDKISHYIPTKIKEPTMRVLRDVNNQLSSYVQGQVTVAICVGIMFVILYSVIGLRYAVSLGVAAGILNMVPYLGSFLAMIPAFMVAFVMGPFMVLKVAIAFTIEQTIEGRFVTPLVLGSKLNIHPITILFVLLTSGAMFGVWGVFLGIPVYASVKVIVKELFEWYRYISPLYFDDEDEDNDDSVEGDIEENVE